MTQPEAALFLGVPFRTYCRYEDEEKYEGTFKYKQMLSLLEERAKEVVFKVETIKNIVSEVCRAYPIGACYLFGSYAKGKATKESDVDLMIVGDIEGLSFYQFYSDLETRLKKKVDVLRLESAVQNVLLMNEILKDGIKIYG